MWRHKWVVIVAVLILVFSLASIAYAGAVLLNLKGTVEIIEGLKDIKVYNPGGDRPLSGMPYWANAAGGTSANWTFEVRNEGEAELWVHARVIPDPVTWGSIKLSKYYFGLMLPGDSDNFTLDIHVDQFAPTGNMTWYLEFYENE